MEKNCKMIDSYNELKRVMDKFDEIQKINGDLVRIANELNEQNTEQARQLSITISSTVIAINYQCSKILREAHDYLTTKTNG